MGKVDVARNRFREIEACFERPAVAFKRLRTAYDSPERRYHSLVHILEMLDCLDRCSDIVCDRIAVTLAIWFHDVVYDVRNPPGRNEELSAALLEQHARGPSVPAAAAMIRHSAHHGPSEDVDTQLFCDLDLYRLGAPHEAFAGHSDDVRFEYGYLSDPEWAAGRAGFLKTVLMRRTIFQTRYWRGRLEHRARENIAKAIEDIQ